MCDGRDDVCEISKRPSPSTRIVTGTVMDIFVHVESIKISISYYSFLSKTPELIFKKCNADS